MTDIKYLDNSQNDLKLRTYEKLPIELWVYLTEPASQTIICYSIGTDIQFIGFMIYW